MTTDRFRAGLVALMMIATLVAVTWPVAGQPATPPSQDEFVPVADLPFEDRLPAAPLVLAAYAVVWVVLLGYVWTLWRRIGAVARDVDELTRRLDDLER